MATNVCEAITLVGLIQRAQNDMLVCRNEAYKLLSDSDGSHSPQIEDRLESLAVVSSRLDKSIRGIVAVLNSAIEVAKDAAPDCGKLANLKKAVAEFTSLPSSIPAG